MNNLRMYKPVAVLIKPVHAVGIAVMHNNPKKSRRGPYRSHNGPIKNLSIGIKLKILDIHIWLSVKSNVS